MQVKKYIANDMKEAISLIKEDLGSRAVIISTRRVKKGSGAFGLFGKPALEVTAAKDDAVKEKKPDRLNGLMFRQQTEYEREVRTNAPPEALPPSPSPQVQRASMVHLEEGVGELRDLIRDIQKGVRRDVNDQGNITHLRYELKELKNLVNTLVTQSDNLREEDLHENLIAIFQQLRFNGIEEKFAIRLCREVQKRIPPEEINNFSYVKIFLARMFMQVLNITPKIKVDHTKPGPQVLAFLGPTGVGKTTTLAKIASTLKLENPGIKISLITVDTYRIAAAEQLKEYAKIIKVPFRVANTTEQLDTILKEFNDKDLLLIDTAGRSQRDENQMMELRDFFKGRSEFTNILVLSSTTKDNDLIEITKRFSTIPLNSVIFTKLDESTSYGSIFNHSVRFKLPISYLTTGQNVPEDIESASRERLINLLLNISGEIS